MTARPGQGSRRAARRAPGAGLRRLAFAGALLALGLTLIAIPALGQHGPTRADASSRVALVSTLDRSAAPATPSGEPAREPAPLHVPATPDPRRADAEAVDDILAVLDAARADGARADSSRPAPAVDPAVASLLGTLRDSAGTSADAPSEVARTAVRFALAQVGRPYVWGATGPDSYDCSGLTWRAYATAGVSLPRVSRDQYAGAGAAVDTAALRPGDLVFFATAAWDPGVVHHVGMYVGRGLMVDAPHPGAFVRVEPVPAAGYVGAVRVTGAGAAPVTTGASTSIDASATPTPSRTPTPSPSPSRGSHPKRPAASARPSPGATTRWPTGPPRPSDWPHAPTTATPTPAPSPTASPTSTPQPSPTTSATPTAVPPTAPPTDPATATAPATPAG